jgi:hypothetical protein
MAAGKRHKGELCYDYRARLIVEAETLKEYLKGKFVWVSSIIVKHKKTDKLMKVKAQGTFRKGKVVR